MKVAPGGPFVKAAPGAYNPRMQSTIPLSLLTAVAIQLLCQAFKVVFYSVRERRLSLSWFVSAGGMPSAHSALVTALSVSVGLRDGWGSAAFCVACVFSLITIYDAFRLRGAVEQHARVLSLLLARHPEVDAPPLRMKLGHTAPEIVAGIVVGGGLAAAAWWMLPRP